MKSAITFLFFVLLSSYSHAEWLLSGTNAQGTTYMDAKKMNIDFPGKVIQIPTLINFTSGDYSGQSSTFDSVVECSQGKWYMTNMIIYSRMNGTGEILNTYGTKKTQGNDFSQWADLCKKFK